MTVPRPLLLAEDKLFGLISVLREFDVPIAPPRHIDFLRGVARLEVHDLDDLYWIGRITLVSRAEDIAVYDHIFREWFADNVLAPPENVDSEGEASDTPAVDERAGDLDTMDLGDGSGRHASADELIANRTFPPIGDAERAICVRIEEAVRTRLPTEPTRRHRPAIMAACSTSARSCALPHGRVERWSNSPIEEHRVAHASCWCSSTCRVR